MLKMVTQISKNLQKFEKNPENVNVHSVNKEMFTINSKKIKF